MHPPPPLDRRRPPSAAGWLPRVSPARGAVIETRAACVEEERQRQRPRVRAGRPRRERDAPPRTLAARLDVAWPTSLQGRDESASLLTAVDAEAKAAERRERDEKSERETHQSISTLLSAWRRRGPAGQAAKNQHSPARARPSSLRHEPGVSRSRGTHLLVLDRAHHGFGELVLDDDVCSKVTLERDDGDLDARAVVSDLVDPLRASKRRGGSVVSFRAGCRAAALQSTRPLPTCESVMQRERGPDAPWPRGSRASSAGRPARGEARQPGARLDDAGVSCGRTEKHIMTRFVSG